MSGQVPTDTRGIVDPAAMMRLVDFQRFEASDELEGLVEWFWSVAWDLPAGQVHDQRVINHPAGNISIGTLDDSGEVLDPAEGRVYGVQRDVGHRRLTVAGWTIAARTSVGGLGVFLNAPARSLADGRLDLDEGLPGLDDPNLVVTVADDGETFKRIEILRQGLCRVVAQRPSAMLAEAAEVVAVAHHAETDRSVCRVDQLASAAGVSVRTLQRLFDFHVGVSPAFVIRRWRIIEAAEAVGVAIEQGGDWRGWASLSAELGYSDQAHLSRDFQRHLGLSPTAYVANCASSRTASSTEGE